MNDGPRGSRFSLSRGRSDGRGASMSERDTQDEAPVRLCCGQRHYGVLCPDGKVMCCLCFGRFDVSELSETVDGDKQDVCSACWAEETAG